MRIVITIDVELEEKDGEKTRTALPGDKGNEKWSESMVRTLISSEETGELSSSPEMDQKVDDVLSSLRQKPRASTLSVGRDAKLARRQLK